jgi:hypothetical protein
MMTTATRNEHYTETRATEPVLFLAFALSEKTWKFGCTMGHGQKPRGSCFRCALYDPVCHARVFFRRRATW